MILFEQGSTNTISPTFSAPAQIAVFGMTDTQYEESEGVVTNTICGDYITFERLAYDDVYDRDCKGVTEQGIKASAPVLDECCCEVQITACNNVIALEEKGIFRAIYHGDNRENILVTKEGL